MPSIDYSTWPDSSDVINSLRALQVWPADSDTALQGYYTTQAQIAANAMPAEFEHLTGRKPFLARRATVPLTATDGYGRLQLPSPILRTYSVTVGDSVKTLDTDFWLMPSENVLSGEPYTEIAFSANYYGGRLWTTPNQISIDALWGYSYTVPAHVWHAAAQCAAFWTLVAIQSSQDISSISQPGFSVGMDLVGPVDDKLRARLNPERWMAIISSFRRVIV